MLTYLSESRPTCANGMQTDTLGSQSTRAKRGASFAEVPVVTSEACSEANTSKAMGVSSPVSEPDPGVG